MAVDLYSFPTGSPRSAFPHLAMVSAEVTGRICQVGVYFPKLFVYKSGIQVLWIKGQCLTPLHHTV
jgi:hypothetical protein